MDAQSLYRLREVVSYNAFIRDVRTFLATIERNIAITVLLTYNEIHENDVNLTIAVLPTYHVIHANYIKLSC